MKNSLLGQSYHYMFGKTNSQIQYLAKKCLTICHADLIANNSAPVVVVLKLKHRSPSFTPPSKSSHTHTGTKNNNYCPLPNAIEAITKT